MKDEKTKNHITTKLSNVTYVTIVTLLFALILIVFFYSVNFIQKDLNKIFSQKENTTIQVLNLENYSLVEKKLHLPVSIQK